ncbi:MAG: cell division protein FtsQ/DivIB [bacterium]
MKIGGNWSNWLGKFRSPKRVPVLHWPGRSRLTNRRSTGAPTRLPAVGLPWQAPRTRVTWWSKTLTILALGLVVYVAFGTKFFVLDSLEIAGNHLSDKSEIEQLLFPRGFKGVNAVTFWAGRARRKLEKLAPIKEVSFHKNLISNTLMIEIVEHQSSIVWQTSGERFLVNRSGVVYDKAEPGSPLLVVEDLKNLPVSLNQQIVSPEFIEFVTSFAANLPRKTNISIDRIMIPETTFEVEMKTSQGWTILLDTTRSYEDQLNNLVRVLRELGDNPPKAYIDLRVGKKVFYK